MSLLFRSVRVAPQSPCRTCTLRLAALDLSRSAPSLQPVRGKKTKSAARDPGTITVRLEKDIPGVGRKGAFVPTTRGEMRNAWFPTGAASYVELEQQRMLKRERIPVVRDVLFLAGQGGKMSKRRQAKVDRAVRAGATVEDVDAEEEEVVGVEVQRVEPGRSQELIQVLVPGRIDFKKQVQSKETGSIFGSVTSADVAGAISKALSANDEGSRVVVLEDDVVFVDVKDEEGKAGFSNRVKTLGRFTVEVKVRGAESAVTKTINVVSQDAHPTPVAN